MLTYRGIGLPVGLANWVWDWSTDSVAKLTAGCPQPLDHQRRFSRDVVGLREYRGRLVSVVALEGLAEVTSGRHHHREPKAAPLPVECVAARLRQFDAAPRQH